MKTDRVIYGCIKKCPKLQVGNVIRLSSYWYFLVLNYELPNPNNYYRLVALDNNNQLHTAISIHRYIQNGNFAKNCVDGTEFEIELVWPDLKSFFADRFNLSSSIQI